MSDSHVVEVDSNGGVGGDEGFAAFCSCGWRCDWQYVDTICQRLMATDDERRDEAYDAAEHEGNLHIEMLADEDEED